MVKINRTNVGEHLMEKQFSIIGKTAEDALNEKNWRANWFMTEEQFKEFELYALKTLKKVFKYNTKKAKSTFVWFRIMFGVDIIK